MDEHIDMDNTLTRAHWCGNFSCTDQELVVATQVMNSTSVGLVGLYLATRPAVRTAPPARLARPS